MSMREIAALGGIGILSESDLQSLSDAKSRVFELMRDGRWHTRPEIEAAADAAEGMRRMRELRKLPGVEIQRMRSKDRREFVYRLVHTVPDYKQASLF